MARGDLIRGLVLGVAVAAAVPLLLRSEQGQALGRAALRAGERFAEKAREFAEELGEIAEDTWAEWQAQELEADSARAGEAAETDAPGPQASRTA